MIDFRLSELRQVSQRYLPAEPSIRQKLQRALQDAIRTNGDVVIKKKDGSLVKIKIDFVCYETLVEATSKDGSWLEIPYDQIIDAYS